MVPSMTMKKNPNFAQDLMMCTLDQIVPDDHLVRKLEAAIDWNFIYDLVEDKYSKTGRPSVDPVVLFKILFLNIILGNNSIRRTCRDIQTDAALRWFLGLNFTDPVPNYSDWSQNYIRRYKGTDVCDQIFSHILQECDKQGFLKLDTLFIDSTHQKASANKNKYRDAITEQVKKYLDDELRDEINEIREEDGKKPFETVKKKSSPSMKRPEKK